MVSTYYIPIKSGGVLPLENLPVGFPPMKSLPYGGKLHLAVVVRLLLLPLSTMESPNVKNAGNDKFCDGFMAAASNSV